MSDAATTTEQNAAAAPVAGRSNPFVGLRPFNTEESLLFFGRRQQTIELLERLHRNHFIAVTGSSGCGKSSLIRAGLIPNLLAGFLVDEREQWLVAKMKPGDGPIDNLAAALRITLKDFPYKPRVENLERDIRELGAEAILDCLTPALANTSNLLLLIDQFEELFRYGIESGKPEQHDEAADFVSLLLQLAEQRKLPIYVVLTMRSDFLGDCDHFHGLPEALNRSQYLVPRLTREQRRQAIEGPVRLFGAEIAPRLLDRLLNDVGDQSDQLPVLQHALMRTWEHWHTRKGRVLDIADYEAVGTVKEAITKDAEAVLTGMTEMELNLTKCIFQALIDTDSRNRQVRNPAYLSELAAISGAHQTQIITIIEKFRCEGRFFLTLTNSDDPLVSISHESLIRQWGKFDEWSYITLQSKRLFTRLITMADRMKSAGYENRINFLLTRSEVVSILKQIRNENLNLSWAKRNKFELQEVKSAFSFLKKSRDSAISQFERSLAALFVMPVMLAIYFLFKALGLIYFTSDGVLAISGPLLSFLQSLSPSMSLIAFLAVLSMLSVLAFTLSAISGWLLKKIFGFLFYKGIHKPLKRFRFVSSWIELFRPFDITG